MVDSGVEEDDPRPEVRVDEEVKEPLYSEDAAVESSGATEAREVKEGPLLLFWSSRLFPLTGNDRCDSR